MYKITLFPITDNSQHSELTYFSSQKVPLGSIVEGSYGRSKILGVIYDISNVSSSKAEIKGAGFSMKKMGKVITPNFYNLEYIEKIKKFAADTFLPVGKLFSYVTPNFIYTSNLKLIKKRNEKQKNTLIETYENKRNILDEYIKKICQENLDKSIWIIKPTILEANAMYSFLKNDYSTFLIHSKAKNTEKIIEKNYQIYITTPQNIGLIEIVGGQIIIVDTEGHGAYRIGQKPSIDSRELITHLYKNVVEKIFFIDTILSIKTRAKKYNENILSSLENINFHIAVKNDTEYKNPIFVNKQVEDFFNTQFNENKKILLINQKTGLASKVVCNDCKKVVCCKKCQGILKFAIQKNKLLFICKQNKKHIEDSLQKCAYCQGWNLIPLGIGIESVKEYIDTTYKIKSTLLNTNMKTIQSNIYISTESVLSVNIKNKFDSIIVISFDSLIYFGQYNTDEKLFRLLYKLKEMTDTLFFQTRIKDFSFLKEMRDNTVSWIKKELEHRIQEKVPPYAKEYILKPKDIKESILLEKFLSKLSLLFQKRGQTYIVILSKEPKTNFLSYISDFKKNGSEVEVY